MRDLTSWRIIRLFPVLLWVGLIIYFSSQPYKQQSIQPILQRNVSMEKAKEVLPDVTVHYRHMSIDAKKAPYQFIEFLFRKASHMFMYGMLAVLGLALLYPGRKQLPVKLFVVLCFVAGIAMLDEWNQGRSPGRTSALQDVGVDLAGGILALGVAILWQAARKRRTGRFPGQGQENG